MIRDVHDRLSVQFATHEIVRKLHDVPPHEVYEVNVDGRRAVYKGDTGPTGNAAAEGALIEFVGERTSLPVSNVLRVGDDYFVATWHPDAPAPDEEREVNEPWTLAAGRALATLHAETAPSIDQYGRFRGRDDDITIDGYRDWHAAAIAYVHRRRSALVRHGHTDVANAVVDFLHDHPGVFDGAHGPVCCHGWATPEHVTVVDGRVACLVDFEHAIAAPGEFDYWRTVLPTFGPDDPQQSFREGYESVRSLPAGHERRKPFYVILNELYYLESLYVQEQHGPDETARQAQRLRDSILETLKNLP